MGVIDTIRPSSVRLSGAATAVPGGTLASITADDSDATYIQFLLADRGNNWSLRLGPHTPAAGYQRHQIRGRARLRCNIGTCQEDIDLGRGTSSFITYKTVPLDTTFTEQTTNWSQLSAYGLDTVGALSDLNIGGGWGAFSVGGAGETFTSECYVDIDCRLAPVFAGEVRDAAGVDQSGGTVTDTNQPELFIGPVDYDGLPELDWTVAVRDASLVVVFEADGSGTPPPSVPITVGLANGAYTATFEVSSTIRGIDRYQTTETVSFTLDNAVPPPAPPLVTVTPEFGGYRVTWTNPGGPEWDDDYVVAEVFRADCTGEYRIATMPDGLNGSYLDLAMPQIDTSPGCELPAPACDITYEVRYLGRVSTQLDLPSAIPGSLILGWPSTAASIPTGWTRVTALDGYYPRGSSVTGTPSATGGATTHSHTTPGHTHHIDGHSHSVGGSTGSSNSSTTSARFNGASKAQADQPHTHSRPSSTGTHSGGTSGSSAPGTNSANNTPLTREVIWMSSDGARTAYPVGALGWAAESLSGWIDDTSSSGRYLKGAAAAGDGGATSGASTHTHTVNSHSHTGLSHDHSISDTGLSNPSSSQEAGTGSSTPRWLPRHTHPMNVVSNTTGNTDSVTGGTTGSTSLDPPHRRLRVLQVQSANIQPRIIGLYVGNAASLPSTLRLCNGANGTPDMRTYFARDKGSDSVNTTGGASSHTHSTPSHTHNIGNHSHDTSVGTSNTGSYEAPSFGDLGDSPTTGHGHSSSDTGSASPNVDSATSGTTGSSSHLPVYKEVHFVRLDGTGSSTPLSTPELKTTEFATVTVPALTYGDNLDRIASMTEIMAIPSDRTNAFPRLVSDTVPIDGGLPTVSTTAPGEDVTLTIAVEGIDAINQLERILASPRVYWSPVAGVPGWFAPDGWSVKAPAPNVKVVQVTMVRQDWPTTDDPEVYL